MAKIIIADDHPLVRKALRDAFAGTADLRVAAEARNGQEVLVQALKNKVDLVILDIEMPGRNGLDVLQELKRQLPQARVLILTMHSEEPLALRALKAGAAGYLTKEAAVEEIIQAVRQVLRGQKYLTPSLAQTLALNVEAARSPAPHEGLSSRELQVLQRMAVGKSLTAISEELSLNVKTISTFRTRIFRKLGVNNNTELAHYAIGHKLVDMLPASTF